MDRWLLIRDVTLFLGGLVGVIVEALALFAPAPRHELLIIYAAMMGLPAFLRADERRNGRRR